MIMLYWLAAILTFPHPGTLECFYCSLLCIVLGTILIFPNFVLLFAGFSLSPLECVLFHILFNLILYLRSPAIF